MTCACAPADSAMVEGLPLTCSQCGLPLAKRTISLPFSPNDIAQDRAESKRRVGEPPIIVRLRTLAGERVTVIDRMLVPVDYFDAQAILHYVDALVRIGEGWRTAMRGVEQCNNAVYDILAPLVPENERNGNVLHLAQRVASLVTPVPPVAHRPQEAGN